jgi:hypothetical protein
MFLIAAEEVKRSCSNKGKKNLKKSTKSESNREFTHPFSVAANSRLFNALRVSPVFAQAKKHAACFIAFLLI